MKWDTRSDEVKSEQRELLPEGEHKVRVEGVEEKVTADGKDQVVFTLMTTDKKKILHFLTDNEKWGEIWIAKIKDCFGMGNVGIKSPQALMGKVGKIVIGHEVYNGTTRAKINPFEGFIKKEEQEADKPADTSFDVEDEEF